MITIDNTNYEVIENVKDALDNDVLKEKITDYYDTYDYIVGDWAYGKLRLKGFNDKDNAGFNDINDAEGIKEYIENYCAYGCKYFIIKRIKVDKN